jgi:hypothetical protein
MISLGTGRVARQTAPAANANRLGPWPWYLSAADFVGLDVDVVDDIAGDLIEECAGLSAPARVVRRAWCVAEVLRALPYLVASTLRRGRPDARLRLLGAMATLALAALSIVAAVRLHVGPPARIAADRGFDTSDIVINNVGAVQMPVRALDARGHTVAKVDLRYERVSGDPIDISRSGAVACHRERGDAVVRASVGGVASLVSVHCRPVTGIHTTAWHDFLPGDPPQLLRVEAVGFDGAVVKDLRGFVRVADKRVATLRRGVLVPHAVGSTRLTVSLGDARLDVAVVVHEIVDRFDNLTLAQRNVAMPLRLSLGDTLHLPVPAGMIWVKWMPRDGSLAHPLITAEGPGYCHMDSEAFIRWLPAGEYGAYCDVGDGARIRVARTGVGDPVISGALLLEIMSR